jgi:YbbR domain-containing protein
MSWAPLHWLGRNFRTLLLAFGLALVVWVSSVVVADPNETRVFPNVSLESVGKPSDMLVVSNIPQTVSVTLFAPRSWLDQYQAQPNLLRAVLDLSGLDQGSHDVAVQVYPGLSPTRIEQVVPDTITVELDRLVSRQKPIRVEVTGSPARGYQAGDPVLDINTATVTGAESKVNQVIALSARLDIANATETIDAELNLRPVDESGTLVTGVQVSPDKVKVSQPITLLGGFRNVVVRVVTVGQVANGYRLTNISVSPPNVVVSSPDPQLVNSLPGFVETEPLDLTGLQDDFEVRLPLNLPDGVSVVGEQNVLVQVSIAAIESSLSINLPVEVVGLGTGLSAQVAPNTVDVILSGPVLELDALKPNDVRVVVDVTGLEPGVHQLEPQVSVLSERIRVESVLPETLEVNIVEGDIGTPTPSQTATGQDFSLPAGTGTPPALTPTETVTSAPPALPASTETPITTPTP